jgi:hypothetical protein
MPPIKENSMPGKSDAFAALPGSTGRLEELVALCCGA